MAQQGRGSANKVAIMATTLVFIHLLVQLKVTEAATYTVGDNSGWTFNIQSWTNGKKFKAGDILIFNYDPSLHNVATVDVNGFNSCNSSPSQSSSKIHTTGKDSIKLHKGQNYFICSIPTHCNAGLKISVIAS